MPPRESARSQITLFISPEPHSCIICHRAIGEGKPCVEIDDGYDIDIAYMHPNCWARCELQDAQVAIRFGKPRKVAMRDLIEEWQARHVRLMGIEDLDPERLQELVQLKDQYE